MKIVSCYDGKFVYNKYLGEMVYARCGKCPACVNARAASWVQRLDLEMQNHLYTWFVTFQYDEQNVNQLVRLDKEDCNGDIAYIDQGTGMYISLFDDSISRREKKDVVYCEETPVLLIPRVRDFQLFMKSLRKRIKKDYNNEHIRYYAAHELGPTTYRPHLHILFFFDSSLLSKDFAKLCREYWRYGCAFDPHPVYGSTSSYVASYVNCVTHLPAIYLHKDIRPKAVFSKSPPIGTDALRRETLCEYFDKGTDELVIFDRLSSQFRHVPLWRFVRDKLYPRIPRYSSLPFSYRVEMYRYGQRTYSLYKECRAIGTSFESFCRHFANLDFCKPFFRDYAEQVFYSDTERSFAYRLRPLERDVCHKPGRSPNLDTVLRFYRALFRVAQNAEDFGYSIYDYVTKMDEFYEKKQKSDLKEWFELQDEYFKHHPVSDYLLFFPNFYKQVNGKEYGKLKDWQRHYLDLYTFHIYKPDELVLLPWRGSFAMRELIALHDKIAFQNTKQKKANDYLAAHKDKFGNIINYQKQ